jgi:replication initiation protein RepC
MALSREASVTGKLMSACEAFTGLPDGAENKFSLIRMAERAGRNFGLSFADLRLLTLYVSFTRAEDWQEGSRPIYTRPVFRTASDLGISARQVNRSERKLESLGLIFRDTRADGGRGFVRGRDEVMGEGAIAFCIDLRPLAVAYPELKRSADAVRAREEAIDSARAAISRGLRQAAQLFADAFALNPRQVIAEGLDTLYADLPQRTPRHRDLSRLVMAQRELEAFVTRTRSLFQELMKASPVKESDADSKMVSHIYNTKPDSESCNKRSDANAPVANPPTPNGVKKSLEKSKREIDDSAKPLLPAEQNNLTALFDLDIGDEAQVETGLDRLRTAQVIGAMPESWSFEMQAWGKFSWRAFCMVAESRLVHLGVGTHAWKRLSLVIGRRAAAVALMALEANRFHPTKPVRNPGGAIFRFADIAKTRGLRLDAMVLGVLARMEQAEA